MILKKCKQKKWLIKLTVAAVMCVSILISTCAMTSCTDHIVEGAEYESEDFKYTYWEHCGGITIKKYIGTEANVVIPEKIGKHPVTRIGYSAFEEQRGIKNITIPNTVTVIESDAFAWCMNLKNITIPDSVTFIGSRAFYRCIDLETVRLSNSIEGIYSDTFRYCYNLRDITIPKSVLIFSDKAFIECSDLHTIYCEAETQPEGWDSGWNCGKKVVWGYKK